jgi:hypothetical protein
LWKKKKVKTLKKRLLEEGGFLRGGYTEKETERRKCLISLFGIVEDEIAIISLFSTKPLAISFRIGTSLSLPRKAPRDLSFLRGASGSLSRLRGASAAHCSPPSLLPFFSFPIFLILP